MSIQEQYPIGVVLATKDNDYFMVVGYSKASTAIKCFSGYSNCSYKQGGRYVYKEEIVQEHPYRLETLEKHASEYNIPLHFKAILI